MQPELYFYEQWLRERHADIRAAVRAARLRPQQDCAARDVDPNPVKEVQVASIEEPDAVARHVRAFVSHRLWRQAALHVDAFMNVIRWDNSAKPYDRYSREAS